MHGKKYFFRSFKDALKERFGTRVYKISVDAGFTCPNRDGSIAYGACVYCDEDGSGPGKVMRSKSITEQLVKGKEIMKKRYDSQKFIAYFQAFSGTYSDVERIKELFDEALHVSDIVGISVGTRPDCLSEETVELLQDYHKKTYLWVELGLQTTNDEVLKSINRGHDLNCFINAAKKLKGLRICTHYIIGLPGDDKQHLFDGARLVGELAMDAVKLHHLYILKGTAIESAWRDGDVQVLELEDYARRAVDFLERIPKEVIVQRLAGSALREKLLAPAWTLDRVGARSAILDEFKKRGTRQGALYTEGKA